LVEVGTTVLRSSRSNLHLASVLALRQMPKINSCGGCPKLSNGHVAQKLL